jgi:hypothetical protein
MPTVEKTIVKVKKTKATFVLESFLDMIYTKHMMPLVSI